MKPSRWKEPEPRLQERGELLPPPGYESLVSVGITPEGPVAIWTSGQDDERRRTHDGWASLPSRRPNEAAVALTAYGDPGAPSLTVVLDEPGVVFPHVQRLPDGTFLVVDARCHWSPEGPEQNAILISAEGRVRARGCLGDGLEHVRVAPDGTIWTAYFDEGIYGNLGWGAPEGPTPLGAPGIVAWSSGLDKTWEMDSSRRSASDCYALNVTGDTVWACPDDDFPILRIRDGETATWATQDIYGARGIVASSERVALIGSSREPSALVVGHLTDGRFVEEHRASLRAADGAPLDESRLHCSGSVAHFFSGRSWSSFDLDDLA